MAVGCGGTFAKIILIIYNIIFLCTGIVLIAVGIWLIADGSIKNVVDLTFSGRNSDLFRNAGILLIAMGALVLVVSIIGFVGAIIENQILLGIYIALLVIIFCGEITGGVLAIVYKDDILDNLEKVLTDSLADQLNSTSKEHYYNLDKVSNDSSQDRCYTSDVGYLWDFVQIKFQCCGVRDRKSGYEQLNSQYNFKNMCPGLAQPNFPVSCYKFTNSTKFKDFHKKPDNQYESQKLVNFADPYTEGCFESIGKWVEKYAPVLIGIGIGFAMLELFGIIFAVCLCVNVDDD